MDADLKLSKELYVDGSHHPVGQKELWISPQGVYRVLCSVGNKRFAVEHTKTGYREFFSEKVYGKLARDLKRGAYFEFNPSYGSSSQFFKIVLPWKGYSCMFHKYCYAIDKSIALSVVRRINIKPIDDTRAAENYLDLRGDNLFAPGEGVGHIKDRGVEVISVLNNPDWNLIKVWSTQRGDLRSEYCEYAPELLEILKTPKYCYIDHNIGNKKKDGTRTPGRIDVVVKYGKGKNKTVTLSLGKFVCIFKYFFPKFRNRKGAVKQFIRSVPDIREKKVNGKQVAHINACDWLHTFNNIMFMENVESGDGRVKNPNLEMRDFIKWFNAGYRAFPIVNDRDEILLEVNTPFRDDPTYIKFRTPQGYADFQLMFQGRGKHTPFDLIVTQSGAYCTPAAQIKDKIVNQSTAAENEPSVEAWCKRRDALLAVDESQYVVWEE